MTSKKALTAAPFVPSSHSLKTLAKAADECRGCHLYKNATQAVFGEGLKKARVMFVGEQPGDQEDLAGKPFVGPAGKLFDRALSEAGIERADTYITNAVKHFKWKPTPRGKRRIHDKPNTSEINACRPWLEKELETIKPEIVVCLGATAARSVFGKAVTISGLRGKVHETLLSPKTIVTTHPSAVLRSLPHDRDKNFQLLVKDLLLVAKLLRGD